MKCDSVQGDVTGIRKLCQLRERCDGHEGCVRVCGRCDSFKETCRKKDPS